MQFQEGVDYVPVKYRHPGGGQQLQSEATDPVWELRKNLLEMPLAETTMTMEVKAVTGAFQVPAVLRESECDAFVLAAEACGFTPGRSVVGMSPELRDNEVCSFIVSPHLVSELSARLAPYVPRWGAGGDERCKPDFIGRRFRCYRYLPSGGALDPSEPQRFGPHYDGTQYGGTLLDGIFDEDLATPCRSQMSVLLYLSGGHVGGETIFYPNGDCRDSDSAVGVVPSKGTVLCFWHGDHLLSPLHEGAPVRGESAPKYIIRTDVFFTSDE